MIARRMEDLPNANCTEEDCVTGASHSVKTLPEEQEDLLLKMPVLESFSPAGVKVTDRTTRLS